MATDGLAPSRRRAISDLGTIIAPVFEKMSELATGSDIFKRRHVAIIVTISDLIKLVCYPVTAQRISRRICQNSSKFIIKGDDI